MPNVHPPELELVSHDHSNHTATVRVSFLVHQMAVERQMAGLRYKESIKLWGADSGPDQHLYSFPTAVYPKSENVHIERSRTVTLADDVLDEDGFLYPTDEVYAKVCVEPILPNPHCASSNIIKHKF